MLDPWEKRGKQRGVLAGPQAERTEEVASGGSSVALVLGVESEAVDVMALVRYSNRYPLLQCLVHVCLQ